MTGNVIEPVPKTTVVQDYMPQSPVAGAADRDCPNCIWHSENGCTVWDCDFVSRAEAKKRLQNPMFDPSNLDLDQTVYGYRLRDLLVFAEACWKAGVKNEDLRDFSQNASEAYRVVGMEVGNIINKTLEGLLPKTRNDNECFKTLETLIGKRK